MTTGFFAKCYVKKQSASFCAFSERALVRPRIPVAVPDKLPSRRRHHALCLLLADAHLSAQNEAVTHRYEGVCSGVGKVLERFGHVLGLHTEYI